MAGIGNVQGTITPDYQIRITIDSPDAGVLQGAVWREYEDESIAVQKLPGTSYYQESISGVQVLNNVEFVPGQGWQLQPVQRNTSALYETSVADGNVCGIANGRLTVASNANGQFIEFPLQRANTDLPGVTLGANQRATGDLFIKKLVPANGGSFDVELTGDSTSGSGIPYPNPNNVTVPVDRVARTTFNHVPTQDLFLRIKTGGVDSQNPGVLGRIYFCGLPNCFRQYFGQVTWTGTGYYALEFAWDGTETLYEFGSYQSNPSPSDYEWNSLTFFNFGTPDTAASQYHFIQISQDAIADSFGNYSATQITIRHSNPYAFGGQKIGVSRDVASNQLVSYRINQSALPAGQNLQPPGYPVRFDLRRDFTGQFQISTCFYPPSGSFIGARWTCPVASPLNNLLTVEYTGASPAGTTTSVALYDSSGASMTQVATATTELGGSATFKLQSRHGYNPVFTFTPDSTNSLTPRIVRVRYVLNGLYGAPATIPVQNSPYTSPLGVFQWTTPGFDAAQQSGDCIITDTVGTFPQLDFRGKMPARTDIVSKSTGEILSVLGHHYVLQAKKLRKGSPNKKSGIAGNGAVQSYPVSTWGNYLVRLGGPFIRLDEQQTNQTYNFSLDPSAAPVNGLNLGYKITDVIRTLISNCGYPATQIDVPDRPLRFVSDPKQPAMLEAYSQISGFCQGFARDYFQAWLVFDSNATNGGGPDDLYGCWRVKFPQVVLDQGPPQTYNNLAYFHTDTPPTVDGQYIGLSPEAYPSTTAPNGQIVVHTFAQKFTYAPYPVSPEFNLLTVTAVGIGTSDSSAPVAHPPERPYALAIPPLYNFQSAFFFEGQPIIPSPDNPDYLGRAIPACLSDPGLISSQIVQFAARRIFDIAMHERTYCVIRAPLILVWDILDALQIRQRPLMAGDAVLLNGDQWFVSQVQPDVSGTGDALKTMANYELFTAVYLQQFQPIGDDSY